MVSKEFFTCKLMILFALAATSGCQRNSGGINVQCGSNEKKDPTSGRCIGKDSAAGPGGGSTVRGENNIPTWPTDTSSSRDVTATTASGDPKSPPTKESISKPGLDLPAVLSTIVGTLKGPDSSAYLMSVVQNKSGGYGLRFRTTKTDVTNLVVKYPANTSSLDSRSGLVIRANVNWEAGGKKCKVSSENFSVLDFKTEKNVEVSCL